MGSRTAFSDSDVLLFHAVAERSSARIARTEPHAREHAARKKEAERSRVLEARSDSLMSRRHGVAFTSGAGVMASVCTASASMRVLRSSVSSAMDSSGAWPV